MIARLGNYQVGLLSGIQLSDHPKSPVPNKVDVEPTVGSGRMIKIQIPT